MNVEVHSFITMVYLTDLPLAILQEAKINYQDATSCFIVL